MAGKKKEEGGENQDLYRALRGAFTRGKPTKVELRHITRAGDSSIRTWDEEHFEGLGPDEFTEQALEAMSEDASTLPGVQRYGLFFFRKNTAVHAERLMTRIKGGDGEDIGSDVLASEEPDERGRSSQIMRHDEAYTRLALNGFTMAMTSMQRVLDRADAMNERLGSREIQVLDVMQRMIDRTAERDFKLEREKKTMQMVDMAIEKAGAFIPLLIASKLEKTQPQLAEMIKQSTLNGSMPPAVVRLLKTLENNPEKTGEFLGLIDSLEGGRQIIGELMAAYEAHKMQNGSAVTVRKD